MRRILVVIFGLYALTPLTAQTGKHPVLTIQRQRVIQSCGAVLDATAAQSPFAMSSVAGLTSLGTLRSSRQASMLLGLWLPRQIILAADDASNDVVSGARIWSWPNPFRDNVSIDVLCPTGTSAEADVFNAIGKHITSLTVAARRQDGITFSWNGLSKDGTSCATGNYTIRVLILDPLYQRRILYSTTLSRIR